MLTDYGAFRDLQRHRLLTHRLAGLTPRHGYNEPEAVAEAGVLDAWRQVVEASADLHERCRRSRMESGGRLRCGDGLPRALLHGHERA